MATETVNRALEPAEMKGVLEEISAQISTLISFAASSAGQTEDHEASTALLMIHNAARHLSALCEVALGRDANASLISGVMPLEPQSA